MFIGSLSSKKKKNNIKEFSLMQSLIFDGHSMMSLLTKWLEEPIYFKQNF